MYYLFERLNTTGTPLTPQEIRNAIYHGPLCDLIGYLSEIDDWKAVYGKDDLRLRGQELILRFLALYYNIDNYQGDMKLFLNMFMLENRTLERINQDEVKFLFSNTINEIYSLLGSDAFKFKKVFNTAFFDAIMLTLVDSKQALNSEKIIQWHSFLRKSEEFENLINSRTTQKEVLLNRVYFSKNSLERM